MRDEREDAFAERIAARLRAPEHADPTFEARAMSAVHAAARESASRAERRSWWLRPRVMRITPLATLAMAAGLVLMLASSWVRPWHDGRAVAVRTDTVHLVRFVLVDSAAQRVSLVGGFNHWDDDATPLRGSSVPGVWTVSVPLRAGPHEYNFVVQDENGVRWVADPFTHRTQDEFGNESSVIFVNASTGS